MRLTKKNNAFSCGYEATEELVKQQNASPIIEKLGKLEDIEEELGIDLETLFTALRKGVFASMYGEEVKKGTEIIFIKPKKVELWLLDKCFKYWWGYPCDVSVYHFKDYGKTWALTKEELNK